MRENIIARKTADFAVRIVNMKRYLLDTHNEKRISDQVGRSGTSIGANVKEAEQAQSRADFINKLQVALKEANETDYWIRLLHETHYLDDRMYASISSDCKEIIKLLTSIIKSTKANS